MKKKIGNIVVEILLIMVVFSATDVVLQHVFHSENLWLELAIYLVFYAIAFGGKKGIEVLWHRLTAKKEKKD